MFGIQILEQLESGLRGFKAETKGGLVRLQARASTDLAAMVAKTKDLLKARAADETFIAAKNGRKAQNNLRQIGIALHTFHNQYKHFPPAALCDKQGKPCLSWRVAILPYIEQGALYNQFKLDEPWDSAHNIKLLADMPKVFAPVGMRAKEPGSTFYQGFIADPKLGAEHATAWETTLAADSPFGAWGTRIPSIQDGTSNTIFVVEAGDAVPWTKPVDLPYDPKRRLPKLGGVFKEGFNALFADGSVRFIPHDFDVPTLRALITRAGGEVIGPAFDKLR
jgi:prepilin-type processing-associated H-X9-DG protein